MQDVLRSGVAAHNEKRTRLVKIITANKKNTFTEAGLLTKGLVELTALARLAQEDPKKGIAAPSYVGLADTESSVGEPSILEAPTMNFEEDKK